MESRRWPLERYLSYKEDAEVNTNHLYGLDSANFIGSFLQHSPLTRDSYSLDLMTEMLDFGGLMRPIVKGLSLHANVKSSSMKKPSRQDISICLRLGG